MPESDPTFELSRAQHHSAVRQIFGFMEDGASDHTKFLESNHHLTEIQIGELFKLPSHEGDKIIWPDVPVFSPFAPTKMGYSQGNVFKPRQTISLIYTLIVKLSPFLW